MIAPTHAIYGPALALIILSVFGVQSSLHFSIVICAILGSIAPDLDHPNSTIGRLFPWVSNRVDRRYGHRTLTHSIIGCLVASASFTILLTVTAWAGKFIVLRSLVGMMSRYGFWLASWTAGDIARLGAAFCIGYTSHLLLDMLTPRGVQLFWPNPNRDVIFQKSIRVETGTKKEIPVALIGLALLALSLPLSEYGPMTVLRWLLATPESAISEYKNHHTRAFVVVDGSWAATKEPIHTTAEILDVQNKKLVVLIRTTSRPGLKVATLSDELTADIIATKVRVTTTKTPIPQTTFQFDQMPREALLSKMTDDMLITGTIHLPKGMKVQISDPEGHWNSIIQVEDELRLKFATKSQIASLQLDDAWETKQDEDRMQLQSLQQKHLTLTRQLRRFESSRDGLTPLGRKLLLSQDELEKQDEEKERVRQDIQENELRQRVLKAEIAKKGAGFGGKVSVRKILL